MVVPRRPLSPLLYWCFCDSLYTTKDAKNTKRGGSKCGGQTAGFALYLTGVDLEDRTEAEYFPLLVEGLTQVALSVFDEEQRHEIACALLDPQLVFISPTVEAQVPQIAARLDP